MMTPFAVWIAIMGNDAHGLFMRAALMSLMRVPPEAIEQAIRRIERETAVEPLLNPSAYTDGKRFDNAHEYTAILRAALALRQALPEEKAVDNE